jgi:methyl-accepting chemotaxis protein
LNSINESLNSINEALNSINEALNSINEALNSINEALNSINEALILINEPLNSINEALNPINESLNSINESLNSINEFLDTSFPVSGWECLLVGSAFQIRSRAAMKQISRLYLKKRFKSGNEIYKILAIAIPTHLYNKKTVTMSDNYI